VILRSYIINVNCLKGFPHLLSKTLIFVNHDVPPGNDTRYNIVKGGIDGKKKVHTGTNHQ